MPLATPILWRNDLLRHFSASRSIFIHSSCINTRYYAVVVRNYGNFLCGNCDYRHSPQPASKKPCYDRNSLFVASSLSQAHKSANEAKHDSLISPCNSALRTHTVDQFSPMNNRHVLAVFSALKARPLFNIMNQQRYIATQPLNIHVPPPPPREFNADGTPKKYRLTQRVYDHKYDWERWSLMPAGVFHTVYYGEFGRDYPPLLAWLLSYPLIISSIPFLIFCYVTAYLLSNISSIGIRPKRYTVEWMEASKERDRAENTNPFTRYLDRRRKERGPNWLLEDYAPTHPHFIFMDAYYHDPDLLKKKATAADEDTIDEGEE